MNKVRERKTFSQEKFDIRFFEGISHWEKNSGGVFTDFSFIKMLGGQVLETRNEDSKTGMKLPHVEHSSI